jgi:hypothetical protein
VTTPESGRMSVSRKSMAVQALFVVFMLLIMRFLWVRNQPERLTVRFIGNAFWGLKISGEDIYAVESKEPNRYDLNALHVRSIYGGAGHVISTVDAPDYISQECGFSVAEGKVTYAVERPRQIVPVRAGTSRVVTAPQEQGQDFGIFLLQPGKPSRRGVGREKRQPALLSFQEAKDLRFRQVSAQGGTPQEVAVMRLTRVCLVGNHVFWIRPKPEESVEVFQEQSARRWIQWTEVTAHSDLMLTSLGDGTTRCIRKGVPSGTDIIAGESGVAWQEPAPFPEPPQLFYARIADGSVRPLGTAVQVVQTHGVTDLPSPRDPQRVVEAGNRLYWTTIIAEPRGIYHYKLMSARMDGTDPREILVRQDQLPIDRLYLHAYRDSVYCFVEASTLVNDTPVSKKYLCRLHPERTDPVEILYKLPGNYFPVQFDGGYLYMDLQEHTQSFWALLTGEDASVSTSTLCRISLDR